MAETTRWLVTVTGIPPEMGGDTVIDFVADADAEQATVEADALNAVRGQAITFHHEDADLSGLHASAALAPQ